MRQELASVYCTEWNSMHSTSALVRANIYRVPYVLDTAAGVFSTALLGRGQEGTMTQED